MAGDWMPARLDLHEDPAVVSMALALAQTENEIAGGLMRVWAWFSRQSRNGHAAVTPAYLDGLARVTGLCVAMSRVGWLDIDSEGGCAIPKWDRWFSQAAKKRLNAARRQKAKRERERNSGRHAAVTPPSRTSVTREEKRREEKKRKDKDVPPPAASGPPEPPAAKPPRKPSGPVQELLSWFRDEYLATQGTPYGITARDGVAATRLLKLIDPETARSRATRWLTSVDPWISSTDRGFCLFASKANLPELRGIAPAVVGGRGRDPLAGVKELARRLDQEPS